MIRYKRPKPKRLAVREGKVRKEFWLDPSTLEAAKRILGVETEREAVAHALEFIVLQEAIAKDIRALRKLKFEPLE